MKNLHELITEIANEQCQYLNYEINWECADVLNHILKEFTKKIKFAYFDLSKPIPKMISSEHFRVDDIGYCLNFNKRLYLQDTRFASGYREFLFINIPPTVLFEDKKEITFTPDVIDNSKYPFKQFSETIYCDQKYVFDKEHNYFFKDPINGIIITSDDIEESETRIPIITNNIYNITDNIVKKMEKKYNNIFVVRED